MSTYREIIGKKIKKVSSDPSSGTEGEMWYNSTTGTLRGPALTEAWVSAAPLGTGRYQSGSFGTQTAAVAFCGAYAPSQVQSLVEEYNGTGWSEQTNYPAAGTAVSGAGTQTAGIACGGNTPSMTTNAFSYNGSSWTAANAMPYAANNMASCGLAKTSVIFGIGRDGSSGNSGTNKSLTFDGTNFSAGPTLNTTRMYNVTSGSGTGTAGLIFGGFIDPSPNAMTNTESFDGSSWSNAPVLNVATGFATGFGTQTNTVTQVNNPNYEGSEKFDGTSWTALPDIGVTSPGGLYGASAGATGDTGFIGAMSPTLNKVAEWTSSLNTITAAAWASIPNYPTPNSYSAGFGITTASVVAGGDGPPGNGITTTGEYDGSSWTTGGALNTGRRGLGAATNGSETAGLVFGGSNPGVPTQYANVEEYNGSAWSEETNLPGNLNNLGGFGTQTAGAALPPSSATTLEYDGSSWASGGSLNTTRDKTMGAGAGLQTAGLCIAGGPVPGVSGGIEEYNGTAWTATVPSTYINDNNASNGIQTAALSMGASNPPSLAAGIQYDGTTARTVVNMGTGRYAATASGSAGNSSALAITGRTPSTSNACEEYTEETETASIKTFTTS